VLRNISNSNRDASLVEEIDPIDRMGRAFVSSEPAIDEPQRARDEGGRLQHIAVYVGVFLPPHCAVASPPHMDAIRTLSGTHGSGLLGKLTDGMPPAKYCG